MKDAGPQNWISPLTRLAEEQERRNTELLRQTPTLGEDVRSEVVPLTLDLGKGPLAADASAALSALEKDAARIAIESLISLAKVNDIDHLGGGLELIPGLLLTLSTIDYETRHFAIEHGHTSIGYYSALAALGFLPRERVIEKFRRSLDIAGHVSWVPGGTPLGSGRLGVTVPVSTGLALGLKARKGAGAFVICHCGDAGWISGQALNGFNGADVHRAPITFVMHRNGIQLSGTTAKIMDKDPRPIVSSLGITILEIPSLHERPRLFDAYREAFALAQQGRPSLIYPVGYTSTAGQPVTVRTFAEMYGIAHETEAFAAKQGVSLDTGIWIPGSLMSFRDPHAMLECLFLVNGLPGGEAHHDGGMKGRDGAQTLANPMLQLTADETTALQRLRAEPPRIVVTRARPPKGTPNLVLDAKDLEGISLPGTDKWVSARAGSEAAYVAVAKKYRDSCFFVSCDLNPSTKLGKAAALLPDGHEFEMSIEEQAASLMADGLSFTGRDPQLNVFATFAAFMEGIAREGFEILALSAQPERPERRAERADAPVARRRVHRARSFSGWSLDWINLSLGYLPFLRRFYAPADARAAFLAVRDAAAGMGGHIVAIPRDTLPVLTRMGSSEPLWNATDEWTRSPRCVSMRAQAPPSWRSARRRSWRWRPAIRQRRKGVPTDVHVVNGFPLPEEFLQELSDRYRRILTIEDGLIGTPSAGLRGFAAFLAGELHGSIVELEHFGIVDPRIAPSDSFMELWAYYGMTEEHMVRALLRK